MLRFVIILPFFAMSYKFKVRLSGLLTAIKILVLRFKFNQPDDQF